MNRAALENLRDRLRDLPEDVVFDQEHSILDMRLRNLNKTITCCCIAGVAVAELCYGGNYLKAAKDRLNDRGEFAGMSGYAFYIAARKLGLTLKQRNALFAPVGETAEAADAADAVQNLLDAPEGDPWRKFRNHAD